MNSMEDLLYLMEIVLMHISQPQAIHTYSETSTANTNHLENKVTWQVKSYLIPQRKIASNVTHGVAHVMVGQTQTALIAGKTRQRMMMVYVFATTDTLSSQVFANSATLHVERV